MKKSMCIGSSLLLMLVIVISSCDFDKTPDPDINTEPDCSSLTGLSFATDILPIFVQHCATSGCHDAASGSSGYVYEGYAGAKQSVDNNRLIGVINHSGGFSAMPKSYKMEDCEITKITTWVNEGALDN